VRAIVFCFLFFSPPTELLLTTLGAFGYSEGHNCENAVPMEIQQLSWLVLFGNSYLLLAVLFSSHNNFSFFKPNKLSNFQLENFVS